MKFYETEEFKKKLSEAIQEALRRMGQRAKNVDLSNPKLIGGE